MKTICFYNIVRNIIKRVPSTINTANIISIVKKILAIPRTRPNERNEPNSLLSTGIHEINFSPLRAINCIIPL